MQRSGELTRRRARWLMLALVLCASCSATVNGNSGEDDAPADDEPAGGGDGGDGAGGSGGGPSPAQACSSRRIEAGPSHWRRLTAVQYKNTIRDLLGVDVDVGLFLSDTTTGRFVTNAGTATPDAQVRKYQDAAVALAAQAVRDLPKLLGCDPATTGEDACARKFFDDFGARAWRRPVTNDDRNLLDQVYRAGKAESFAIGIKLVLEALLQSPSFLYLVETGRDAKNGFAPLDGYELASRLSYVLWDSMPDAELLAAAKSGALETPEGLRAQADRLMKSPRFLATLASFHEQLFAVGTVGKSGGVARDSARFPEWTEALTTAVREETGRFVSHVFTKGGGTIQELLSAPYAFPSGPLVTLYGGGAPDADGKVAFANGARKGILTQAAVLAAAVPIATPFQAVLRGKVLRNELFCEELPPPPADVVFKEPPNASKLSQQELLRAHEEDPSCKGCHERLDPLGFGLEPYDLIGRLRARDASGAVIDSSGRVVGTDVPGEFSDTAGLIDKLATSRNVRGCFARHWFRFGLGYEPSEADECSVAKTAEVLAKAGGNLRQALTLLVTSDSFRHRGGL